MEVQGQSLVGSKRDKRLILGSMDTEGSHPSAGKTPDYRLAMGEIQIPF
jgi:hypothetical protein